MFRWCTAALCCSRVRLLAASSRRLYSVSSKRWLVGSVSDRISAGDAPDDEGARSAVGDQHPEGPQCNALSGAAARMAMGMEGRATAGWEGDRLRAAVHGAASEEAESGGVAVLGASEQEEETKAKQHDRACSERNAGGCGVPTEADLSVSMDTTGPHQPLWGAYEGAAEDRSEAHVATMHAGNDAGVDQSTVARGTEYEECCVRALMEMGMCVERCGGAGDEGVDLSGHWQIPGEENASTQRVVGVVGQCKRENKRVGPKYVREFEAVVQRYSQQWSGEGRGDANSVVGLLFSTEGFTHASCRTATQSNAPLLLCFLDMEGDLVQVHANDASRRVFASDVSLGVQRRALPDGTFKKVMVFSC